MKLNSMKTRREQSYFCRYYPLSAAQQVEEICILQKKKKSTKNQCNIASG